MMRFSKLFLSFIISFFCFVTINAQEYKGIKYPGNKYESKCGKTLQTLQSMPPEVQLSVLRDENWNLYFGINDARYFDQIFKGSGDGVAIDIISKDQIVCGNENNFVNSWSHMGNMIYPIFLKENER